MKSILIFCSLIISLFGFSQLTIYISIYDKINNEYINNAVVSVGDSFYGYSSFRGNITIPANVSLNDELVIEHPNYCFEKRTLSNYKGSIDLNGNVLFEVYGYPCPQSVNIDLNLSSTNKIANDSVEIKAYDFDNNGSLLLVNNHQPKVIRSFNQSNYKKTLLINTKDLHDGYFINTKSGNTDTLKFNRNKWHETLLLNTDQMNQVDGDYCLSITNYIHTQNKQVKLFWKERKIRQKTIDSLHYELKKCKGEEVYPVPPEPIEDVPGYIMYNSEIKPSKSTAQLKDVLENYFKYRKIKKQGVLQFSITTFRDGTSEVKRLGKVSEEHKMLQSIILRELKDIHWDYAAANKKIRYNFNYTFIITPK